MDTPSAAQIYPNTEVLFTIEDFSQTDPAYQMMPAEGWAAPVNYEFTGEMDANADTSSCTFATNIITDMGTGVSSEQVKAELGCAPNTECKVDNSTVFTVMDRYDRHLRP